LLLFFKNGLLGGGIMAVYQIPDTVSPLSPPAPKQGVLNSDNAVDIFDYNLLVGNFGK